VATTNSGCDAPGLRDVGWWFDTSDLTPQQTAQQIITESPVRAGVER
jgi:hypothetical protein